MINTIAWATISYHTLRSAKANPVKALRYEIVRLLLSLAI